MDVFSKQKRSWIMSKVKGKNTAPELLVRSTLHRMGYRFRLHRKDLPGNPDIVLPNYKAVIFVHGCFWHQHSNCPRSAKPSTNKSFWDKKLTRNRERDKKKIKELRKLGWRSLVLWQCQIKKSRLQNQLQKFLKPETEVAK
jgi:DNA mismatch endonuclease, patch repair protein